MEPIKSKPIKLVFIIVDRGKGAKVLKICNMLNVHFHIVCLGRGTAKHEILTLLGLGETEKDIVLSIVSNDRYPLFAQKLDYELNLEKPGHGIMFTIPISSVFSVKNLCFISGLLDEQEGKSRG